MDSAAAGGRRIAVLHRVHARPRRNELEPRPDSPQTPARELLDWTLPEREFERFFHAAALEHALLLEPLRAVTRASGRSPYQSNGHLDDVGHGLLARALVQLWTRAESTCFAPGPDAAPVAVGVRARLREGARPR